MTIQLTRAGVAVVVLSTIVIILLLAVVRLEGQGSALCEHVNGQWDGTACTEWHGAPDGMNHTDR